MTPKLPSGVPKDSRTAAFVNGCHQYYWSCVEAACDFLGILLVLIWSIPLASIGVLLLAGNGYARKKVRR